jgi:hypothetical protein
MEAVTRLAEVRTEQTRNGNTRFVARGEDGREYTTFREEIGARAQTLQGAPVRISYHEEQRGQYNNVYLDEIERAADSGAGGDTDVQEAAWRTAVDAAPWLVGEPQAEIPPDELYEKLKPFEERVAADIDESRRSDTPGRR